MEGGVNPSLHITTQADKVPACRIPRGRNRSSPAASAAATRPSIRAAAHVPILGPSAAVGSQSRPTAPAGIGAIEIEHGDRGRPLIALTFHGSGDPNLTTRLLSLVEREGLHVSVMAVGLWVNTYPELTRRILHGGHDLGNHTMHHLSMLDLSAVRVRAEIEQCASALRRATGSQGQWFRASATQHTNATIRIAASRAGYNHCVSYDVDGLDWQDPSASKVERAVLTGVSPGSIVSLHLGHPVTIAALPAILSGLRDRGLVPVSLTELLG